MGNTKTVAADWDAAAAYADEHEAVLVRAGDRFSYRFTSGQREVEVWVEDNIPRFGCRISRAEGEEGYPLSFRAWNVETVSAFVDMATG